MKVGEIKTTLLKKTIVFVFLMMSYSMWRLITSNTELHFDFGLYSGISEIKSNIYSQD